MTLSEYFRVIRERWVALVTCIVLGLLGSTLYFYVAPRTYTSSVTMYISAPVAGDLTSGAYEGGLLSEQRTSSYSELVTSRRVLEDVVKRLRLPISADELREQVSGSAPLQTVLVVATATDRTPDGAAGIANAVADSFMTLVAEVERPTDPNRPAPVVPRVVERAEPPAQPTSPQPLLTFALGGVLGLLIGLGLAFARSTLDRSVRSADDLAVATGLPVLCAVVDDVGNVPTELTNCGRAPAVRSRSYWQLWTSLRHADLDPRPQVILVTSPQKQEGKTTTVCNLAAVAASTGARVLVIEADLRRPRMSEYLAFFGDGPGLADVLSGRVDIAGAIRVNRRSERSSSFDVMLAGSVVPSPSRLLETDRMGKVIARARGLYDVVLVDTPSTLPVSDAAALVSSADGALVVVRFGSTTFEDTTATIDALRSVSGTVLGTVLTMAPAGSWRRRPAYYPDDHPAVPASDEAAATDRAPARTVQERLTAPDRKPDLPRRPPVVRDDRPGGAFGEGGRIDPESTMVIDPRRPGTVGSNGSAPKEAAQQEPELRIPAQNGSNGSTPKGPAAAARPAGSSVPGGSATPTAAPDEPVVSMKKRPATDPDGAVKDVSAAPTEHPAEDGQELRPTPRPRVNNGAAPSGGSS